MPRLAQVFLTCAFIALAALALKPYWPAFEKFYADFQLARTQATQISRAPASAPIPPKPRDRAILKPQQAESPIEEPVSPEASGLLAEARRRAATDPADTMAWLQAMDASPERMESILAVVAIWASQDSESALLWLETNAKGIVRLESLDHGMKVWAQTDPNAAALWLDGMANDGSKRTAAAALARSWAENDPTNAATWVETLPNGAIRDEAASALISIWAAESPHDASVWALSEAEFLGNRELLDQSIAIYTEQDAAGAEAFVRSIAEAFESPEGLDSYLRTRALLDPLAAMDSLTNLAEDDPINLPSNATVLSREWSRTDSVAVSQWLSKQAPGPIRDAAIQGFSETMLQYEPEAAVEWTNTLNDPALRRSELSRLVSAWAQTQPVEAMRWVKAAELDADFRDLLLRDIPWD